MAVVRQREIGVHARSFRDALRAALREDPNVVLIGEMRDLETTEIALEVANTGHLVFATLHTNSASATVDRIINQFPQERQQLIRETLSDSLKAVISQTLVRKKDGSGRIAAYEVLIVTPAIANCIRERKTHMIYSQMQTGVKSGMIPFNDYILRLVMQGAIDQQAALQTALDKDDMERKLKIFGG